MRLTEARSSSSSSNPVAQKVTERKQAFQTLSGLDLKAVYGPQDVAARELELPGAVGAAYAKFF